MTARLRRRQVYQGIDLTLNRLDNVVELRRPALPTPSWLPVKALPAEALLTLKHTVAVTGPATVQISFVGTDVNLQGALPPPPPPPHFLPGAALPGSRTMHSCCPLHFPTGRPARLVLLSDLPHGISSGSA